jgi:hypothetical protein
MSTVETSSFGAFPDNGDRSSLINSKTRSSSFGERVACVLVAALLTLFTTQLIDLAVFGGKPAFSSVTFLTMNLWPLILIGLIGALTRRPWIAAIVVTIAGLGFAVAMVGFSHGFEKRALAQYFMYGTVFLCNAMFYVILGNVLRSVREDLKN